MIILDKMEAALRFYANRENVTYSHPYGEGDTIVGPASKALREYESLKGQIAVVPVQTSEARKAALEWHRNSVGDPGLLSEGEKGHYETIESALQQPDTSEAVRVLVDALKPFDKIQEKHASRYRERGGNPDALPDTTPSFDIDARELPLGAWRAITKALSHPAVIAAMKGVDHEKVI